MTFSKGTDTTLNYHRQVLGLVADKNLDNAKFF